MAKFHLSSLAVRIVNETSIRIEWHAKKIAELRNIILSETQKQQAALTQLYFEFEQIYDKQELPAALRAGLDLLVSKTSLKEMTMRVLASRTFKVCRSERAKAQRWQADIFRSGESFATITRKKAASKATGRETLADVVGARVASNGYEYEYAAAMELLGLAK